MCTDCGSPATSSLLPACRLHAAPGREPPVCSVGHCVRIWRRHLHCLCLRRVAGDCGGTSCHLHVSGCAQATVPAAADGGLAQSPVLERAPLLPPAALLPRCRYAQAFADLQACAAASPAPAPTSPNAPTAPAPAPPGAPPAPPAGAPPGGPPASPTSGGGGVPQGARCFGFVRDQCCSSGAPAQCVCGAGLCAYVKASSSPLAYGARGVNGQAVPGSICAC